MNSGWLALAELLLVFGLLFWFGFSQLRALKKAEREAREKASREARDDDENG
jgi:hypothetical protein